MRRPGDGYVAMLVATFGFEPNEEENTRARRKELRAEERRLTRPQKAALEAISALAREAGVDVDGSDSLGRLRTA